MGQRFVYVQHLECDYTIMGYKAGVFGNTVHAPDLLRHEREP